MTTRAHTKTLGQILDLKTFPMFWKAYNLNMKTINSNIYVTEDGFETTLPIKTIFF